MEREVRVRFAPSPTGDPHVGGIRTAIFNWLFAKHNGGRFVFRIEDTDQARLVKGSVGVLQDALKWLGIEWDEGPEVGGDFGPYFQSQRLDLFQDAVQQLIQSGHAYRCFCSSERLAEVRSRQAKAKGFTGYDRRCRDLSDDERSELESSADTTVVRFRMPLDGTTTVNDIVRGEVTFENKLVDDYVLLKSDGFPTYHLAHVVDDHHMKISHVLRAEEWLPSIPRHLQLYEAFGWEPPQFAHLPIILAPDRSKLSKRHGATSVLEYRDLGYLPQSMFNFLTLLGWSLDDKTELFTVQELVEQFTLDRITKSSAIFNTEKLDWMNGHYIRTLTDGALADALLSFWTECPPESFGTIPDREYVIKLVPLVKERMKTLRDAEPLISFLFKDEVEYESEELVQKGMDSEATRHGLEVALTGIESLGSFESEPLEELLRATAGDLNVKAGQLFGSLRIATTGLRVAPPLFQTMEVMGKERTVASVRKAIERLG